MGQLTFQATLGGAINLSGPNIATTTTFTLPSADGTNGQALTTNGTGTLAFATFGDVVGPASSTDNAIARFDLATGKLLQNSVGILSDAGALSGLTTIDATGNITTNGGKFSLKSASVEYGSFSTASGDVTLASAASGYLKLVADGALLLGSAAGGEVFRGSSTGLRLTNSLGVGGTSPSASGAGITFPATQSTSTDANTLDDYEEGTWTPTLTCASGTITVSTSYDVMTYTKIGRMVTVSGGLVVASVSSPTGALKLEGLPFANAAGTELSSRSAVAIRCNTLNATAATQMQGQVSGAGSFINIAVFATGTENDGASLFKANSELTVTLSYVS